VTGSKSFEAVDGWFDSLREAGNTNPKEIGVHFLDVTALNGLEVAELFVSIPTLNLEQRAKVVYVNRPTHLPIRTGVAVDSARTRIWPTRTIGFHSQRQGQLSLPFNLLTCAQEQCPLFTKI
jgi:hypothetical protein